jgi:hypothetical protein
VEAGGVLLVTATLKGASELEDCPSLALTMMFP